MTDNTQPEAMDLADWLEAVGGGPSAKRCAALLREQHARIAELEAQIEALSGVQALSAAPAEQEEAAQRLRKTLDIDPGVVNDPLHPRYIAGFKSGHAAGRRRATPAASPTPPAEQAAHKAAPGEQLGYKQALGSNNCMQCCVSYMLGLPLADVPHFADGGGWGQFASFVESKGYSTVMLPGEHEPEADYLASGRTERGTPHMVVMNGGKLVFDPHPSCSGLSSVQCVWLLAKRAAPQPAPLSDDVVKDAALWHWIAEYLVGTRTDLDDEIVASKTVNDLRKLVEAAIKQGGKA